MKNEAKIWHLVVGFFAAMVIVLTVVFMMFSSMGLKPTPGSKDIVVTLITTIGVLGSAIIVRDVKKQKEADNKPDLSTPNYDDMIGHILDNIQEKYNVYRCAYWVYTNGTYTGDDYSMQNCSMVVEKNKAGVRDVITEMQMIPKVQFRRNITPLRTNPYYISFEDQHDDPLAHFNKNYGIRTAIYFKALNKGKWTGVLGLGFNSSEFPLNEDDIGWIQVQIARIEAIVSNIKKR